MPLRGGAGAFVPRRVARQLISTVPAGDVDRLGGGVAGWLERIQARRSALLVVSDRPSGVKIALRWRLSPEKFRLESEFRSESWTPTGSQGPWHSQG
jgi:hypothetical protein